MCVCSCVCGGANKKLKNYQKQTLPLVFVFASPRVVREEERPTHFFKKKNSFALPLSLSRDRGVGAPGLHDVDERRQIEAERLGGGPRCLERGRAGHGGPAEEPQTRPVDVQESLRPFAARAARAV